MFGCAQRGGGRSAILQLSLKARMLQENHILAALPEEVRTRLHPLLELVPMPLGKVLYESGDTLRHVYFPIDCIVSLLYVMEDGSSAEISVVGNEGLLGVALFMGGGSKPSRASVQRGGSGDKLPRPEPQDALHTHGTPPLARGATTTGPVP